VAVSVTCVPLLYEIVPVLLLQLTVPVLVVTLPAPEPCVAIVKVNWSVASAGSDENIARPKIKTHKTA